MTQLSVLHFDCRYLRTENIPHCQDNSSGLNVFGKKAVCSEKQMHTISYICCRLTLTRRVNVFRAVLFIRLINLVTLGISRLR